MMRRILWPLLLVVTGASSGCLTSPATMSALDAVHRALTADEQIVAAYHQAVMESFDHARGAHVSEAKHIVDRLAAQDKLTAEVVKEGFDRLLANLDEVEARRARFDELYRLARRNNANAKEALAVAGDSVTRSSATQEEIRSLVEEVIRKAQAGSPAKASAKAGGAK